MAESDPYELARFVEAQREIYSQALAELRAGHKRTHWMWFVFPQLAGLGHSATAQYYALSGLGEASAYLQHALLGARLRECVEATLALSAYSAHDLFGSPDDLKFRSSLTLFERAGASDTCFEQALERYFRGQRDERTLALLRS